MTGSGLKCTLFTAVLAGGLFAFVRLQNRFGSNDYDPRNFTRSKRGTYGTSGWMSEKEMRSVLEVAGPERAKGSSWGKTERGSVICLPEDTRLNKHIAVFGASGTMKSKGRHPAGPVPEHPARRVGGGRGSKVGDVRRHGGAIQEARL